jgi:phospholipid transport system substrate-binding protein
MTSCRSILLAGLIAIGLLAGAPSSSAREAPDAPRDFVAFLADRVVARLGGDTPRAERAEAFQEMIDRYLALPIITRFVTGRHWSAASDAERQAFRDAFRTLLVNRFLPAFEGSQGMRFKVEGAESLKTGLWTVALRIDPGSDASAVAVQLRVIERGDSLKVADVMTRGVSLGLTLREEYTTFLRRHDGDLGALTRTIRERSAALSAAHNSE